MSLSGDDPAPWPGRYLLYAVGALAVGWGVRGLLADAEATAPPRWAAWFLGLAVLHDLVLAPLVIGVGALVVRRVPPRWRAAVQSGLVVSALLVLVSVPFVLGLGVRGDDPSALPLPYGRNLAVLLVLVWAGVAGAAVASARRHDRSARPATFFSPARPEPD